MKCPKCKSEDVKVQIVSEEVVRTYKHSLFYRLLIGWGLKPIIWICTLPFRMIGMLLPSFGKYSNTEHKTMAVCQHCGHTWKVR